MAAGVIHISAAGDHTNLPVMFVGFMIVATLQVAVGALLFWRRPSRLLIAGALALTISSLGMWLLSRTAGLPFLENGHVEPVSFRDGVTKLFELATIPALLLLLSRDLARVSLPSSRLSSQTLGVLGASVFALMTPALLLGGGTQHSHEQAVALGLHHDDGDDDGHLEGHELAQAHEESSKTGHNGHPRSANAAGEHQHTDHGVAGAPVHLGHENTGGEPHGHAPRHHAGGNEGDHGGGQHDKSHPEGEERQNNHSDGGHGRGEHEGEHEGGHGGGGGGSDEPISVSYEPTLSVCVSAASICVP